MRSFMAMAMNSKAIMKGIMAVTLAMCPVLGMAEPTEARFANVEGCQFLGKIEGSSGYGKHNGWQPVAKSSALKHAERLGASHIVWERMIPVGAFNGRAVARAYSCGS